MDVRVLVCWHPGDLFHASVIFVDFSRGWYRFYSSKRECADHLRDLGLITIMDQDQVVKSDFDLEDRILTTSSETTVEILEAAGFVEFTPRKLN